MLLLLGKKIDAMIEKKDCTLTRKWLEKYILGWVKEMRHDIWWSTFVFNILVENRIPGLKIYISSSCSRGKVLVS